MLETFIRILNDGWGWMFLRGAFRDLMMLTQRPNLFLRYFSGCNFRYAARRWLLYSLMMGKKIASVVAARIKVPGYTFFDQSIDCNDNDNDNDNDEPDEDQGYYSNDDFVCLLSKEEKEALDNLEI